MEYFVKRNVVSSILSANLGTLFSYGFFLFLCHKLYEMRSIPLKYSHIDCIAIGTQKKSFQ